MFDKLHTVGCSVHTPDGFVQILQKNSINVIADVRSVPFSRYTPQFNQNQLRNLLRVNKIMYVPLSTEFGARRVENQSYTDGQVDFSKVQELESFKKGISRVKRGLIKGYSIALMCTEKDPLDCHRFSLVSRNLEIALGCKTSHILFDGSIETTEALELRMLKKFKLEPSLFENDYKILVKKAYDLLGSKIAYTEQAGAKNAV